MTFNDILIRLSLSFVISLIIGYEREVNQSNAGLKTHTIVGVSATIIALIQAKIVSDVIQFGITNPELIGVVRSDPSRLIAQVVSGIGFLGAGTIVVTKRNISGLTTAAAIWSTAAIGIAIGMGYYEIAGLGFLFIFFVMSLVKRVLKIKTPQKIIIKHLGNDDALSFIFKVFESMDLHVKILKYDLEIFHDERIVSHVFEVESSNDKFFNDLVSQLSTNPSIVSVQSTNI